MSKKTKIDPRYVGRVVEGYGVKGNLKWWTGSKYNVHNHSYETIKERSRTMPIEKVMERPVPHNKKNCGWTAREEKVLLRYPHETATEIAKRLKNRTPGAVRDKRRRNNA